MDASNIVTVVCALITSITAVIVARIEHKAAGERKSAAKRAERRATESRLAMDMMYAAVGLAMDTAKALKEGHTNGTVDDDLQKASDARTAYENWIRNQAAEAVAKV